MATAISSAGPEDPGRLRRAELAEFLRSRRERLTPQQAGVIYTGRRRTPGLRREEVAQLGGMSTTWYTWLEQGRDIKVSDQVLDSLSRTLQLDHDERSHLFALVSAPDPTTTTECDAVTPQMRAVLAKLDPYPACVQGGKYDLLAYNTALRLLLTDLDDVPRDQRNCVWLTFTHPAWRESIVNWEATAARMVANLRVAMADHVGDPCGGTSCPGFGQCPRSSAHYGTVTRLRRSRTPEFGRFATPSSVSSTSRCPTPGWHHGRATAYRSSPRPILRPNDVSPAWLVGPPLAARAVSLPFNVGGR